MRATTKLVSLRICDSTSGSTVIHSKRRSAENPCSLVGENDTSTPHDFPASQAARFRLSASDVVCEMNGAQGAHIVQCARGTPCKLTTSQWAFSTTPAASALQQILCSQQAAGNVTRIMIFKELYLPLRCQLLSQQNSKRKGFIEAKACPRCALILNEPPEMFSNSANKGARLFGPTVD